MEQQEPNILKDSLRKRALRFRYLAFIALGTSVLMLIASIYLFLYASELSFQDNVKALEINKLQLAELNNQREKLNIEVKISHERFLAELEGVGGTKKTGAGPVARQLQDRMKYLQAQLLALDNEIADTAKKNESSKNTNLISTPQIISTSVTRLIVLGTLIFLVQILVNLYKYNMRVAGHYDAISDALELFPNGIDSEKLVILVELLSTNKIDFGNTPNSILNNVVDVLKASKA